MWGGSFVVTINTKLLGGKISFFQCVCVLGYCVFPIVLGAILVAILRIFQADFLILKLLLAIVCLIWSAMSTSLLYNQVRFPSWMWSSTQRRTLSLYIRSSSSICSSTGSSSLSDPSYHTHLAYILIHINSFRHKAKPLMKSSRWMDTQRNPVRWCNFRKSNRFFTKSHIQLLTATLEASGKGLTIADNTVLALGGRGSWGWPKPALASRHLNILKGTSVWKIEGTFAWNRRQSLSNIQLLLYFCNSSIVFRWSVLRYPKSYGQYVRVSKMKWKRRIFSNISVSVVSWVDKIFEVVLDQL